MKAIALVALLAALALPARAEPPCWQIRLYVTIYGEKKAVSWARDHGYSRMEIEEARKRCLAQ